MMKIRRLQRRDENNQWYGDAYVYENDEGQIIFRYNLTWESVGARYNKKFKETGVSLEDIETIMPLDGQTMRWLPIEVVEEKNTIDPIVDAECPKCGNMKAEYWEIQTRSADEPPTRFHRCTKCRHTWREYT